MKNCYQTLVDTIVFFLKQRSAPIPRGLMRWFRFAFCHIVISEHLRVGSLSSLSKTVGLGGSGRQDE
jgi:hypothetical protein